ncbi:hypothetical protein [Kineosporia succinea]|uniref:Uncharacterized protein n=1 Tax=Kineosporia succinea TaxID=84632 RepID=A0ABT9P6G8_9ACTN|nr:hypothetical protein [Kineosporia succinea]MDP9828062.1 hypothetical protein [Kineosporia succinea]
MSRLQWHELRAENDRLRTENERLKAGADETALVEGATPTPGQWIAAYLAASAQGRRDIASAVLEQSALTRRCFEMDHENELTRLKTEAQRLREISASVTALPDGQLHVEWHGPDRDPWDWTLIRPHLLDGFIEKHNALVRELAEIAAERTAAWQAYAETTGDHSAAEALCEGCSGTGEHKRWCPRAVGKVAAVLGALADTTRDVAAMIAREDPDTALDAASIANRLEATAALATRTPTGASA